MNGRSVGGWVGGWMDGCMVDAWWMDRWILSFNLVWVLFWHFYTSFVLVDFPQSSEWPLLSCHRNSVIPLSLSLPLKIASPPSKDSKSANHRHLLIHVPFCFIPEVARKWNIPYRSWISMMWYVCMREELSVKENWDPDMCRKTTEL